MLKIGLVGLGNIGSVHARNIVSLPGLDLAMVYDPAPDLRKTASETFNCHAPDSLDILLRSDIDAVVVASSTDTHSEIAIAAARAGKAIYCEKPIDLSLDKALATAEAIRPTAVPVMMGFNRRYDESHAALHHAVKDGSLGRLQLVLMTSRGPNYIPPDDYIRASGGFYRDKGVHFFDLLRFIAGEEVLEVAAMGGALSDPAVAELGDVDTFVATLRLASGALVQIENVRRINYGYDERLEVLGTNGMIESGRMPRRMVTRSSGASFVSEGLHQTIQERLGHTYAAAMAAFGRFVTDGSEAVPSLDDGLAAQMIAEAAVISARDRRTVAIAEILEGRRAS